MDGQMMSGAKAELARGPGALLGGVSTRDMVSDAMARAGTVESRPKLQELIDRIHGTMKTAAILSDSAGELGDRISSVADRVIGCEAQAAGSLTGGDSACADDPSALAILHRLVGELDSILDRVQARVGYGHGQVARLERLF